MEHSTSPGEPSLDPKAFLDAISKNLLASICNCLCKPGGARKQNPNYFAAQGVRVGRYLFISLINHLSHSASWGRLLLSYDSTNNDNMRILKLTNRRERALLQTAKSLGTPLLRVKIRRGNLPSNYLSCPPYVGTDVLLRLVATGGKSTVPPFLAHEVFRRN